MKKFIIIIIILSFTCSTTFALDNYVGTWKSTKPNCLNSKGQFTGDTHPLFRKLLSSDIIIQNNGKIKINLLVERTNNTYKFSGKVRKNGTIRLYGQDNSGRKIGTLAGKIKNNSIKFRYTDESVGGMYASGNKCQYEFKKSDTTSSSNKKTASTEKKEDTKIKSTPGISKGSQEDLIVNVGDRIFFNYDSAEIDGDAQELLQDQAAWLNQYPRVRITIEGHADERSTFNYALALGDKRAIAVKNYLVSLGVDNSRISTLSYGNTRPAVIGSNDGAWAQNRRAVTIVD